MEDTPLVHARPNQTRTPLWSKATTENITDFNNELGQLLSDITIPNDAVYCRDCKCNSVNHCQQLEQVTEDVMGAISVAVRNNIPHTKPSKSKAVPGWTDLVAPEKEAAQFWYAVWKSAGKPVNTQLDMVRRRTRNKYHQAIRKVKKHEDSIRKNKFLDSCLSGQISDIFTELKKSRKIDSRSAGTIDGESGSHNIAETFKTIYAGIYNVHAADRGKIDEFIHKNNDGIKSSDITIVEKINPELVKKCILQFKNNKNDSNADWKSNALKMGVHLLAEPLCDILKSSIVHGFIPKVFQVCTLIPIVKDNKSSKLTSSNYRLIAIGALMIKIFDKVLLELCAETCKPSQYQFGYQKNMSTTICTWTMLESINYFRNRETSVFLCLLDLTKAFDQVVLSTLFHKLSKKIHPVLLRFVIFSYMNQECAVRWEGVTSSSFNISNGVRQGAVASPTFFNIYIDGVFQELKDSGCGCYIKDVFHGAVAYADDLGILSPTREGLQTMIYICESYFSRHGIKISTNIVTKKSKSKCIYFGSHKPKPVKLYNRDLPYVTEWKHLGHTITSDECMSHDMLIRRGEFIGKYHALRQELGAQYPAVYIKLINIYLISMYGSNLWDLGNNYASKVYTEWNKAIRSIMNLPIATHRYILEELSGTEHLQIKLCKRFQKFHMKVKQCSNPLVANLYRLQAHDMRSIFGRNCALTNKDYSENNKAYVTPENQEWRLNLIAELMQVKFQHSEISVFDMADVDNVLQQICTD